MTENIAIRYTSAERDYDWSYTTHIGVVGVTSNGNPVRKVHIEASRAEIQCGRYASAGGRLVCDHVEFAKQVEYGFIKLTPKVEIDAAELAQFRETFAEAIEAIKEYRELATKQAGERAGADLDRDFQLGLIAGTQATLASLALVQDALDKVGG